MKKMKRIVSFMLCMVTAFSLASCSMLFESADSISSTSSQSSEEKKDSENKDPEEGNPDEEPGTQTPGGQTPGGQTPGGQTPGGQTPGGQIPGGQTPSGPAEPNPDKELDHTAIDSLGHKIAYYKDGSWEDLGRETKLDFTPKTVYERYGYQQLEYEMNSMEKCEFYQALYNGALALYNSNQDVAQEEGAYPIVKVDGGILTSEEQKEVWRTLRQDCPEFYFLGTQSLLYGNEFWLCIDEEYASASKRAQLRTAIESAALECDKYINGVMSEVELALTINDYLTSTITYAYEADGVTPVDDAWAHNIVGWATMDAGVCETYAESFAYLGGLFGLECWTVLGQDLKSNVGHAWNILRIDGYNWYNVDVTWNDGYESETEKTLIDRQWFGMAASEFNATHQADSEYDYGISHQVRLPEFAEIGLEPVNVKKDGGNTVMYASMETLFDAMREDLLPCNYEVTFYPDTNAQKAAGKVVYPDGAAIVATEWPRCNLTLIAKPYVVDAVNGYYYPATVALPESVSLMEGIDLTVEGCTLTGGTIDVASFTVTLKDGADVQASVSSGSIISRLCVNAGDGYARIRDFNVAEVSIWSGTLYVDKASSATKVAMGKQTSLCYEGAGRLSITTLSHVGQGERLYFTEKTTGASSLSVGNIALSEGASGLQALTMQVDFSGASDYPTIQFNGALQTKVYLIVNGLTAITPSGMTKPVAKATGDVNNLHVFFVEGGSANEKSFTKDGSGNIVARN